MTVPPLVDSAAVRPGRLAIGSLGGTITMTSGASGGVTPTLGMAELLAAVPDLSATDDITATTLMSIPGASLSADDVLDAVRWARTQVVEAGATGVVLAQGTDTLEETSYLASLYWDCEAPLIFTGAMRAADAPSSDGAANLLAACRVASSPRARGAGVLVVMDDTIHAAHSVYKGDTFAPSSMRSRGSSVLGHVWEGEVSLARIPTVGDPLPLHQDTRLSGVVVPMLTTYLGDNGEVLDAVLTLHPDGLVVAGFGVGHVSESLARKLEKVSAHMPVIYASRVPEGAVGRQTYGFVGSEIFLRQAGAIPGGMLSAPKARLLLSALIGSGVATPEIAAQVGKRARV